MARKNVYLPYILGSDSPISYLYQNIAALLDKSKFEVTVLTNRREPVVDADGVTEKFGFDRSQSKKYIPQAMTALGDYDLIHTGGCPRSRYYLSMLTRMRNPDITQVHSLRVDVDPAGKYRTEYKRKLHNLADITTAVSQHTAETAGEVFGADPEVVYNGVDVDIFRPDYPCPPLFDQLGITKPVLLYVGSFQRRKRPRAVVEIAKRLSEFEVLMIGDGKLHAKLSQQGDSIEGLYLPGRIDKRKLPQVYANAAGFVFPSIREGCPNVVLEAMAAETPIIGYQATSMPELVESGERGYLVAPDDTAALTDAAQALTDQDRRVRFGRNARRYVEQKHTFERIVSQYQSLYERVL